MNVTPETDSLMSLDAREIQTFTDRLQSKLMALLAEVEKTELYQLVASPDTSPKLVATIIKYILLEVFSYGPHVTEATFTAIGRLPKTRPDLMKPMILHDLSEVDHGEMALRDFIKLGGDEEWGANTPNNARLVRYGSYLQNAC